MRNEVLAGLVPLALTALLSTGCAARVEALSASVPRVATPVVVDEVLKAGEDPRTRERIARILATPEMQRAVGEVAQVATAGALDAMSSDESRKRIHALTNELASALAEAGGGVEIERAIRSIAVSGTRGALRATADEIPTTVAPAIKQALVHGLGDPQLQDAVSGIVTVTTRQAIVGAREAMSEVRAANRAEGKPGPLAFIGRALTLSWGLAFGLGVLLVGILAWALRLKRRTSRYRLALVSAVGKSDGTAAEPEEKRLQRLIDLLH